MDSDFLDDVNVTEDNNDYDIVIVGAGLCGLTTAYSILEKDDGLEILIIESNEDIGGRANYSDFGDAYHANFSQKNITELLHELSIGVYPKRDVCNKKNVFFMKDKLIEEVPTYKIAEIHSFLLTIHEITTNENFRCMVQPDIRDLSKLSVRDLMQKFAPFNFEIHSFCRAFVYSVCGIKNLENISALWFLKLLQGANGVFNRLKVSIGDENRYFVQGGMMNVTRELCRKIKSKGTEFRNGETVLKIETNNERAYVHTEGKCYKCGYVIIAVPPPESSNILFDPNPENLKFQSCYTYGENVFFQIFYRESFWREKFTGSVLAVTKPSNLSLIYDATYEGNETKNVKGILAGFASSTENRQRKSEILEILTQSFQNDGANSFLQYKECQSLECTEHDKVKSGCPMSAMRHSCFVDFDIEKFYNERILFGASEYANYFPGTTDGAIEAGKTVSYLILSQIRPQTLNIRDIITMSKHKDFRRQEFSIEMTITYWISVAINVFVFFSFLTSIKKQ